METVSERLDAEAPGIMAGVAAVRGLHSFRILLVPDPEDDATGAELLLNGVYDGALVEFLRELVAAVGPALGRLYEPLSGSLLEGESLVDWLVASRQVEATFYIGIVGRTAAEIRSERRLHELLQGVVDDKRAGEWTDSTPAETIRRALRDHLLALEDSGLPHGPRPELSLGAMLSKGASMASSLANPTSGLLAADVWKWTGQQSFVTRWVLRAFLVVWGLYTLIPTLLWLLAVRYLELSEPDEPTPFPDPSALQALMENEDLRLHEPAHDVPARSGLAGPPLDDASDPRGRAAGLPAPVEQGPARRHRDDPLRPLPTFAPGNPDVFSLGLRR